MRLKKFLAAMLSLAMIVGILPTMYLTASADGNFGLELVVYKYTPGSRNSDEE